MTLNPSVTTTPALSDSALPAIEAILPHRGTMLLLDAISACTELALTAQASVCRDAWYADADGAMPAWIGLELMAQAIAAHVGLQQMRAGSRMRPGVLLGSRSYNALQPAFSAAAPLRIEVQELLRSEDGFGAYQCSIHQDDALCAEAVIKVFQPEDFRSFIAGSVKS